MNEYRECSWILWMFKKQNTLNVQKTKYSKCLRNKILLMFKKQNTLNIQGTKQTVVILSHNVVTFTHSEHSSMFQELILSLISPLWAMWQVFWFLLNSLVSVVNYFAFRENENLNCSYFVSCAMFITLFLISSSFKHQWKFIRQLNCIS